MVSLQPIEEGHALKLVLGSHDVEVKDVAEVGAELGLGLAAAVERVFEQDGGNPLLCQRERLKSPPPPEGVIAGGREEDADGEVLSLRRRLWLLRRGSLGCWGGLGETREEEALHGVRREVRGGLGHVGEVLAEDGVEDRGGNRGRDQ